MERLAFFVGLDCEMFHNPTWPRLSETRTSPEGTPPGRTWHSIESAMDSASISKPIFLFVLLALAVPLAMAAAGWLIGPSRPSRVKAMPYESGMDPIHDTRRRFDVRFYLVAIAFLVFDVELLFLYPWAVARGNADGIALAVNPPDGGRPLVEATWLVFAEAMVFIGLLALGFAYAWRRGVFRWR